MIFCKKNSISIFIFWIHIHICTNNLESNMETNSECITNPQIYTIQYAQIPEITVDKIPTSNIHNKDSCIFSIHSDRSSKFVNFHDKEQLRNNNKRKINGLIHKKVKRNNSCDINAFKNNLNLLDKIKINLLNSVITQDTNKIIFEQFKNQRDKMHYSEFIQRNIESLFNTNKAAIKECFLNCYESASAFYDNIFIYFDCFILDFDAKMIQNINFFEKYSLLEYYSEIYTILFTVKANTPNSFEIYYDYISERINIDFIIRRVLLISIKDFYEKEKSIKFKF
ncbi:hypothetical protein H311_01999 [Anncaliia algerae PRA109]|nr:hypothetical protein H311_01999 [Anncaliia algerae PRA109]